MPTVVRLFLRFWQLTLGMARGPLFLDRGPDAELYRGLVGYPVPDAEFVRRHGFDQPQDRVGAFSHFDQLYPVRWLTAAACWLVDSHGL